MKKKIEIINTTGEYTGKFNFFELEKLRELGFLTFALTGGTYTVYKNLEALNRGGV